MSGLADGVFYATVTTTGPTGGDVDARPSDALNLALVTDAPIQADAALLQDPAVTGRTEWQTYPEATATIAEEVRQSRQRDLTKQTNCEQSRQGRGPTRAG
jgi:bifunctional DNase/RNase